MPTLVDIDGFAHQSAQGTQGAASGLTGIYELIGAAGQTSFDTAVLRSTAHWASLKLIEVNGSTVRIGRTIAGAATTVTSVYFRVATAPSTESDILHFTGLTNAPKIQMETDGKLTARVGTSGGTPVTTSGRYDDGNWHRLDLKVLTNATTYTIDWQVDGVAQSQASRASQTAANTTGWALGSNQSTHTLTCWYADFVISATSGDYPLGPHLVLPLYPNAEGTETLGTTNKIQDEAAGQTNLYQKVDDWNGPGNVPDTSTYVTYASTTLGDAASNFAEWAFTDPEAIAGGVWDVIYYIAAFAAGTAADTADLKFLASHGGTVFQDTGLVDYSGSASALGYKRGVVTRPAGGWTVSNLAAMVAQWGFSNDTNPQPRLSGLLLEYASPTVDLDSGALAASGSGATAVSGMVAELFAGAIAAAGSGTVAVSGIIAELFAGAVSTTGSGATTVTGTIAELLTSASVAGSGTITVSGLLAALSTSAALAGAGTVTVGDIDVTTGAIDLGALALAGAAAISASLSRETFVGAVGLSGSAAPAISGLAREVLLGAVSATGTARPTVSAVLAELKLQAAASGSGAAQVAGMTADLLAGALAVAGSGDPRVLDLHIVETFDLGEVGLEGDADIDAGLRVNWFLWRLGQQVDYIDVPRIPDLRPKRERT